MKKEGINPIPHVLWKDVITRGWAIMAHIEKMALILVKKPPIGQNLFWNTYLDLYLSIETKNSHLYSILGLLLNFHQMLKDPQNFLMPYFSNVF